MPILRTLVTVEFALLIWNALVSTFKIPPFPGNITTATFLHRSLRLLSQASLSQYQLLMDRPSTACLDKNSYVPFHHPHIHRHQPLETISRTTPAMPIGKPFVSLMFFLPSIERTIIAMALSSMVIKIPLWQKLISTPCSIWVEHPCDHRRKGSTVN
jgi:hypothetical protein